MQSFALVDLRSNAPPDLLGEQTAEDEDRFVGSGANFKKGRRADPGALRERESLACQIGLNLSFAPDPATTQHHELK